MNWWCRNCGAEILVDSKQLKFCSDVRPRAYVENVYCDQCKENYDKQVGMK